MMGEIFINVLNMSITAGWLILAVVILRMLLRKAPKMVNCILWAIVAVRLICPFTIESVLSLIPTTETVSNAVTYLNEPIVSGEIIAPETESVNNVTEASNVVIDANANQVYSVVDIVSLIWVVGVAVMLAYLFISYLMLRKRVSEGVILRDNIWLCDRIDTPFIMGVIRPRIFIPSSMDETQMEYVIAHEMTHIKRWDNVWKPFASILLVIHWFNPLMWMAYILFCRDIEFACDECVIGKMEEVDVKKYMNTLVSCSVPHHKLMAYPVAFGEIGVKSRIKAIVNYKKPAFWVSILAIVAIIILTVCFLTDPIHKDENDNSDIKKLESLKKDETPLDVSILTDEQKKYLKESWGIEEEELSELSYEGTNYYLAGTGMELYNQSSGMEAFGVTYMEESPISEVSDSERLITYEEILDIRLKGTEMRLDDFTEFKYEIVDNDDTSKGAKKMMLPMEGYKDAYVIVVFWYEADMIHMQVPHISHIDSGGEWAMSILYDQAGFKAYFEMEPRYTMEGKAYVGLQYGSVTEDTLVINIHNWSENDQKISGDYEIYEVSGNKENLVVSSEGEEVSIRSKMQANHIIKLDDGMELEENKQYIIKYGKDKTGYIYGEIIFQR